MSKDAAAYAQKLARMDTLVKSSYTERPEQGENLSLGCYKDREETAEEAVKMWYVNVIVTNPQSSLSAQLNFRRDPWYLSKTSSVLYLETVDHRVRFIKKIQDWILNSERIRKRILCFSIKQINPRTLGSWRVKITEKSISREDSSVPLIYRDPRDLGLICLVVKELQNSLSDSFRFKNPILDFLKETHL